MEKKTFLIYNHEINLNFILFNIICPQGSNLDQKQKQTLHGDTWIFVFVKVIIKLYLN